MKKLNHLVLLALAVSALTFTSCLHIIEDLTIRKAGNGTYKMTVDMSEVKGMMSMLQGMGEENNGQETDSTAIVDDMPGGMGMPDNSSFTQMGQEMANVAVSLKGIEGITNVVELNDTTTFMFGYSFDFKDEASLNRALKVINKEKYKSNSEEQFKYSGKSFERLGTGDIGSELKKALSESEGEEGEIGQEMEMLKMFFADMSYEQRYNFPDQVIKKGDNELGTISDDQHSYTIAIKPFSEDQANKKVTVAAKLKLK